MKIFTSSEWAQLLQDVGIEELDDLDILGTSTNPDENDVPDGTTNDSVCIANCSIENLHARVDWLWQEGMATRANALMNLTLFLEIELHGDKQEIET